MNEPVDQDDEYWDDVPPADDRDWDFEPQDPTDHIICRRWDGGREHIECRKCHVEWPCASIEMLTRA